MRAALVFALILGCRASADVPPEAPGPTMPTPTVATCPATHVADGPACAPRFDACGDQEIAKLGGGCERVGVDACAEGFASDARGGCRVTLPTTPCAPGTIALPGLAACEPIASCGAGTFGELPETPSTLYVDASAAGGDGSRSKPFTRIADAVAAAPAGATIAIAAGTYDEDVAISKELRVVGRCPAMTTIRGVASGADAAAVVFTAKGSLERVSVTGPATGVSVDGASGVTVDSVRVFGAALQSGIWLRRRANALVRRAVVEGATTFGVIVSGSTGRLERSHVLGTRRGPNASVGVRVNPDPSTFAPGELTVTASLVEKNENVNAEALSAKLTIEASVIRDGVPLSSTREWGAGVLSSYHDVVKVPGDVTIRQSLVAGHRYIGVLARDSKLLLDRSVVRDTLPEEKDKNYGRGVVVQGVTRAAELEVRASVVEQNHETGIDVNGSASARILATIVRDTRAVGATGTGVFGELIEKNAPDLTIDRSLLVGNSKAGAISAGKLVVRATRFLRNKTFALVTRGGQTTLSGSLVEDTHPSAAGEEGHAILALPDVARFRDARLVVEDVAVRRAHKAGIAMFGGKLSIARSSVQQILPSPADPIGALGISIQSQRQYDDTDLELDASFVAEVIGAGVVVNGGPAKLHGLHVRDVRLDESAGFGDGVLVAGRWFEGSGLRAGSLSLTGAWIERAARSGVAMFGGSLAMESTFLTCNAIPLNVESVAGWNGKDYVEGALSIDDRGGNTCGCTNVEGCAARSTNLKPSAPVTAPPP